MTPPESAPVTCTECSYARTKGLDVCHAHWCASLTAEGATAERARILAILENNGGLRASFHAAVLSTDGGNRGYHRQGMIDTCSCAACLDDMFADFMGKARARIGGIGT